MKEFLGLLVLVGFNALLAFLWDNTLVLTWCFLSGAMYGWFVVGPALLKDES